MSIPANSSIGPPSDAFRFGANWQRYVSEYLTPERERIAAEIFATIFPARVVTAAADTMPPAARQAVAKGSESREPPEVDKRDVEEEQDGPRCPCLASRNQGREQELEKEEEGREDRDHDLLDAA